MKKYDTHTATRVWKHQRDCGALFSVQYSRCKTVLRLSCNNNSVYHEGMTKQLYDKLKHTPFTRTFEIAISKQPRYIINVKFK